MSAVRPVAIIGAGISGLSCGRALRLAGVEVRLFEVADRAGGRCATRLWQGHLVDHGIPYFTAQSSEFKRELLTSLHQFRLILAPVLDANQKVVHSRGGPRFYVAQGNNYFAHVLSQGLEVCLHTPVETVSFKNNGIECLGETYRAVVSSLPGPQTAALFSLDPPSPDSVCRLSAVLEYAGANIGESFDCYGRLTREESEPLAASYCENHKEGRILGDKTVFVLQASPEYSRAHADLPEEESIPELAHAHEELWKIPAGKRTASFVQCWRLSRDRPRPLDLPPGAFVCGDSRHDATVEDGWLDGRRTAEEVLAYLAIKPS
jgi:predicted NAD/FAD-dependent oxidoreductase